MGILVHGYVYSHTGNAQSALMLFIVLFLSAMRKRSIRCLKVNDEYSAIDAFVHTPPAVHCSSWSLICRQMSWRAVDKWKT